MKAQILTLVTASPLIAAFSQTALRNLNQRLHGVNDIHTAVVSKPTTYDQSDNLLSSGCTARHHPARLLSSPVFVSKKFRSVALFARPKAEFEEDDEDDEDDDDIDYQDDDEEEEDEDEDEDVEIGNDDDEEEDYEEELEEITMEYADDDGDEDEEYEYYDDDEEIEEESADGFEYEDEGAEAEGLEYPPDVWDTYAAELEDPPTALVDSDDSDPKYAETKESILSEIAKRKEMIAQEKMIPRNIQGIEDVEKLIEYFQNEMTDEEKKMIASDPDVIEAEKMIAENNMQITKNDLKDIIIQDEDGNDIIDPKALEDFQNDDVPFQDMHGYDAFPASTDAENGGDLMFPPDKAYNEKDLVEMDDLLRQYRDMRAKLDNQTFFGEEHTFAYLDVERDWPLLDNETQSEMLEVMETDTTMACPEPELWLMYDNNFNVTNLILASFKHNQEAPIMFTQWMPQLRVYERYADQREREFEWTWDDVEQADMEELERYYKGIGYDSIPKKDPSETGIIDWDESELDDEEREMLALENWYDEVYNEEEQNLLFDDENFEAKDNVFAPDYSPASEKTEALAEKFMKEHDKFQKDFHFESQEWRDQFATVDEFEVREDPEGQAEFRGHLVIACAPLQEDIDVAEKITERFKDEFGKAVYVETRILGHARKEDNVYEIWLESYEIDLLHSKRQAFINSKLWTGPSEVDDAQLDYLVDRVRDLISDESRYSYRMNDDAEVKI